MPGVSRERFSTVSTAIFPCASASTRLGKAPSKSGNRYQTSTVSEDLDGIKTPLLRTSKERKKERKRLKLPSLKPLFGESTNISNINVGVNLEHGFSNKGFSFGVGVSAKIPLSTRISAELGANYSRMTVGTNVEPDMTDTTHMQTIGIRHTVGAISVPLSLNYTISENFSVSLGVTPLRVISDRRKETLQWYRWEPANPSQGDSTRRLVGERREFQYADSTYKNNTYLGFVRLSGGISPPFLRKYNTVIAPYIAIPVGKLRNDRYQWLNGGVSIRMYLR